MKQRVLAIMTLWWREMVRFLRQRSRVVGALGQPLVFWVLLGAGFRASFQPAGAAGVGYLEYLYPGIITLILLFTAIFSTIAVVEDRKTGFLQGVLVSPVSRTSIVLGQALGGTSLALLQGCLFLLLAPAAGIGLTMSSAFLAVGIMFLVAFALTSVGLIIAWRMDSTQGFHAIMNLILMPVWFLSGAFFPATDGPTWLTWVMYINPLTYGMAALRGCLYLGTPVDAGPLPALFPSLIITMIFAVIAFVIATSTAQRSVAQ